jgi:hypothetical protein
MVSGMACSQGRQPVSIFYPFGHSMLYAYEQTLFTFEELRHG